MAEPLTGLMQQAVPGGPASIANADPGAALALALHVQMVDAGLQTLLANGLSQSHATRFRPAAGWHGSFPDEWIFEYTAKGKAHKLILHCSLQRATGRMFVNATEANNAANNQVLGLQLINYVDGAAMGSAGWAGVVARQTALHSMFSEHVLKPLVEGAQDLPEGSTGLTQGKRSAAERLKDYLPDRRTTFRYVLPAVAVTAVTVGAVAVYAVHRSRQRGKLGR